MTKRTKRRVPRDELVALHRDTSREVRAIVGPSKPSLALCHAHLDMAVAHARWARLEAERATTTAERQTAVAVHDSARQGAFANMAECDLSRAKMRKLIALVDREENAETPGVRLALSAALFQYLIRLRREMR